MPAVSALVPTTEAATALLQLANRSSQMRLAGAVGAESLSMSAIIGMLDYLPGFANLCVCNSAMSTIVTVRRA